MSASPTAWRGATRRRGARCSARRSTRKWRRYAKRRREGRHAPPSRRPRHIEYSAGQDIETALERLIVDALRDAGGEEWKTLSDDARRGRREALSGWAWAEGNPVRSTVFLQVLDGLEQRCLRVAAKAYETANAMAVASVVLQGLLSEGTPESAQALAREWSARGGEFAKTGATLGEFTRTRTECLAPVHGRHGSHGQRHRGVRAAQRGAGRVLRVRAGGA